MKLSDHKINLQLREEGGWVEGVLGDLDVKVRGSGNKDWAKLEQKLVMEVPRKRRINGLQPDDRLRINGILILETSLLDWRGMENGDGIPEPYSYEAAKKYLTNPEYESLVWACLGAAGIVAEQGQAEIEDDAKN